ncbi:unnamed protein product [Rotaria sp. Silwood1]|nr:unnamed protein product [Rotaria sp. Silwood1]CAF5075985.1 unnamed protein product [Rotaria sp. Silwood1]
MVPLHFHQLSTSSDLISSSINSTTPIYSDVLNSQTTSPDIYIYTSSTTPTILNLTRLRTLTCHVRIMFDEFHNITTKPSEKSRRSSLTGQDKISSIKLDNSCWRKSKQSPS